MHRNRSVNVHQFSMVPRADVPRSGFRIENTHKTTLDAGYLYPVWLEEVLPGDTFSVKATIFARLATPIVPVMDNLYLETCFFFVPNRLVWSNWQKFCGERVNLNDGIDFTIPKITSPAGGYPAKTIYDYFGLPTEGQVGPGYVFKHSALPLRAYTLIYNEWFRDQNLQDSAYLPTGDSDDSGNYSLKRRGKRHDYFTSALPWVQKGDSVPLPLGTSAPVRTSSTTIVSGAQPMLKFTNAATASVVSNSGALGIGSVSELGYNASGIGSVVGQLYPNNLYADLSEATAATINQIRQAFQIQKLLERDARGGTRYTEVIRSHFGVVSPDARLQRPEYLGGGVTPVNITPIAQTTQTGATGTPQGNLAAFGTALAHGHGFTQSFTEHGHVMCLVSIRADLTYQQGLRRMWSRSTRYDYYWPVFAHLGEQAILNKEIYCQGTPSGTGGTDDEVFGYQERWAEYRHHPSQITGLLRSTHSTPLDVWHLAQKFTALPTLNATFIEDTPPIDRVVATTAQTGQHFVADMLFSNKAVRPMPLYSVPGLVDHF